MDLEANMASLDISARENKKRRFSGMIKPIMEMDNSSSSSSSEESNDSLSLESQNDDSAEPVQLRRSSRKKIKPADPIDNRRVLQKPRKLGQDSSLKDIENYYLDKRVKRMPPSLETIFEEPQQSRNVEVFMSSRKFKRLINFNMLKNPAKIHKRKMKAKGVSATKRMRNKKVSLDFLMSKLASIDE